MPENVEKKMFLQFLAKFYLIEFEDFNEINGIIIRTSVKKLYHSYFVKIIPTNCYIGANNFENVISMNGANCLKEKQWADMKDDQK